MTRAVMRRLLAVAIVLVCAVPAAATVYLPVEFREMVTASTFIVHGRVADVRSEPTADRTRIATYVTLDVDERLKGTPGESITFRVPGGQIGRYRRVIVGAPQFERGDEVVLFLSSRGPSIPYVFGLSQGVYRVSRSSGRALVAPPAVTANGSSTERVVRGDPARRPLPIEEFAKQVRAAIDAERAR